MLISRPHPWCSVRRPSPVRLSRPNRSSVQLQWATRRQRGVWTVAAAGASVESETDQDAIYSALEGKEAWLVSSGEKIPITGLWTAEEKCVLVFARSMGCVFCQEYARQLKRDVLPMLEGTGIKLFLISVGTPDRGREFSELTEFPASQLIADPQNELYDAAGWIRNIQRTFFDPRTPLSIFGRALRRDRGTDLIEATAKWKPWIPPKPEQALQQGGVLIFEGQRNVFRYEDPATASHMEIDELLKTIT